MVDEAGSIRYASPATSRMLGYEESELVGREGVELVHPEDAPSFLRDLEAVRLNAARSFDARARARHKDGSYRLLEGTWTNLLGEPGVSALVANFRDVTERERSLQALAEAEERYRNLSESSPDAILVHAFGEVLYANAACVSLLGAAMAEQIVGRSIWSLVDQRDHELTRARLRALAEGEHQPTSQLRWLRMDGSAVDLEVAATPINYEGRPAVQAVARDITGRLQQEQALRTAQARSERLSRMYAALSATNEEILKTSSPEALYRRLCELLVEHGGLRLAAVRLVERETGWIESVAHAGGPASYLAQARIAIDRNRPQAQGPSVRVVLDGCTLVNNDYLADPTLALWHGPAREAGIAAMMSVPLRRGGEVIGLLSLYAGEAGWFDPELVGLAERMAGNVSFALDGFEREAKRAATERRVRLEHEVTRMLAEADSASEGLRAVMRAVCEAEDWDCARYFAIDGEAGLMRIVECWGVEDPGVQGFLRASAGQAMALGEGLAGRVWESGAPLWVADAVSDPRVSAQGRAIIGEICKALVLPVHAQSRTIGVLAISGRQIREPEPALLQSLGTIADQVGQFLRRKTAERATRESEERFRSLTELSADWYWEQDAQFRFTAVAGAGAIAMTNGSTAPYLGKTRWETPDLEPYEGDWQAHRAQLERRESFHDLVLRRRFADGTSGYMSVSGEPVFDAEGRFAGYRGVAKNVTDKVRAALALRESEARFRSLTGLSSDWYWEQDAELRFVSTGGVDKLRGGITAAQHEGLRRWELPGTEALAGSWDEHKAVLAARLPFRDFMLRRTAADGTVHYISVSGEPIFGEGGSFRGYRGVAKDVTASHLAVLAVRESEERFRNLSGLSSDWYWEQDAEFRFTRTTVDRGSPVFGEPTVTLGKARWELPLTPLSCGWEQHRETLRAHRTFREFEYSYADAKGEPRYVSASGYPVFDEAGRFTGYRGIARDITERKHAEQRMALHAERQEAIARFGQYALGRRTVDELYAEAARTLRGGDVDAACALELMADGARYLVRAADGAGAQRTLGMVASIAPDSLLPATLRENAPRIIDEDFLARRPVDGPGREWLHAMKSALYIPVRAEDNPASALSMYSRRAKAFGDDDVRFAEAVAHVLSTALQRHRAEQRLAHLAQFDGLTGLPNRTLLQDRFAQALLQSQRRQVHAGVLFVDLDRFKLINDTLGHHQGDALIRQVGERLVACVRPGDTVGRISGDEFAVVLADLARPDDASIVAQKALDALAKPFDLGGNEAYVTASIGIAVYPADGEDAETLLKSADMAMYRAKESARNSYCFFTAEMNQRSVAKVQLNTDLRRALERDEFTLHYQPKVDLASGKLRGMEALLRWKHPSRGLVSPGEFIPALEDSGLILPVGEWVIEEACRQVLRWTEGGAMPVPIAVNLSPKQFRRRDLDALIRAALVRTGVSAEFLELEITESCLMENPEDAVRALRNLRAAGLRISVDDFGTGYSSLSYLTRLPLSALKIDRSFVRDAESSAEAASIVRAVIDMAQNLRLTVIAEGVETEQQAAFLRRHGCDQAQGYFYGRPVPADEITPRLARP
jgi:diguanylate cyclase (GGDEF)-like protein/PAS domain S-box-containing protein